MNTKRNISKIRINKVVYLNSRYNQKKIFGKIGKFYNKIFNMIKLKDYKMNRITFYDCIFLWSDFKNIDFENCRFINCIFESCTFDDCNLIKVIFNNCITDSGRVEFNRCDIREASFNKCNMINSGFAECNLNWTSFYYSNFEYSIFDKCNVYFYKVNDRTLYGASFIDCKDTNSLSSIFDLKCPEEGEFTGYIYNGNFIVAVKITEDAIRISSTTNLCRASKMEIIDIRISINGNFESRSTTNINGRVYKVGEFIIENNFNDIINNRFNYSKFNIIRNSIGFYININTYEPDSSHNNWYANF